jgi:hypothetical protein
MYCKHCGYKANSPNTGSCSTSPTKHHVWENEHPGKYHCQYCGTENSLTLSGEPGSCSSSPTKHHVWT